MKKLSILLFGLFFLNSIQAQMTLTKGERKSAIKYLNWSSKELKKSLKGLTSAQLNFRESVDKWSIQDCLYHIAFTEGALRKVLDDALAASPDPVAKAELKTTDEQIKANITDRSTKFKTFTSMEPVNTGFKSFIEAKTAYKSKRAMLVDLMKTTNKDLRNLIATMPFGAKFDSYQVVLFISGHTNRHTQQIEEIKAAAGYPKMKS